VATENAVAVKAEGDAALGFLAAQLETQSGFSEVLASLNAGRAGTLGGVWGSSRALVAAALARHCPGTLIVVLPHLGEVDALADDLALFTDAPVARLPAWESDSRERVLHDDIFGERTRLLKRLADDDERKANRLPAVVVTSIQALLQPVASREELAGATRRIAVGERVDTDELTHWLAERGCHGTTAVELPGEFSLRGGILDVFPPDALNPVRIELFGDEIESIRSFDAATQRSLETLAAADVTVLAANARHRTHFASYLPAGSWFMLVEPADLDEEGRHFHRRLERPEEFFATSTALAEAYKFPNVTAAGVPAGSYETTAHLQFESVEQFSGDVARVRSELDSATTGQQVCLVCETEAEAERLGEVFRETRLAAEGRLTFVRGRLSSGFRIHGNADPSIETLPAPSPRRGGLGRGEEASTSFRPPPRAPPPPGGG
jgi:transcription-repair coupling factor (superfamily II helicase)